MPGLIGSSISKDSPQVTVSGRSDPSIAGEGAGSQRQLDKALVRRLLIELHSPATDAVRRAAVRDNLVSMHLALARHLAWRFGNRGEPSEDLAQVAVLGLLKAVVGFDCDRGVDFSSYAVPTIVGELKRHFRDKAWSVQVPRRLKEMRTDVTVASGVLTHRLGRTPTTNDLAVFLDVTEDEIRECQVSSEAYSTLSLSTPVGNGDDTEQWLADVVGGLDRGMEAVEDREALRPLIRDLPPRERRIIGMRFYENMTQTQIADTVGISQMSVSRLLTHSLAQLREGLVAKPRNAMATQ
ncbi:MAG: SigB/SigF/SigG family RNA polymerase sigma factor [Geodermatophilaceae bacterium]|nr:SigB/SigF/SigG family RNA polymerase sigma factor [Geodermatophilaceae bacterium]